MNTTRTRASKSNLRFLLEEILEQVIKQNYNERLKDHQKEIDLLRGNHTEILKRIGALEEFMKVEYTTTTKYEKKRIQTKTSQANETY